MQPENSKYPLVSIVTPSYNQGRYLAQTIESVIQQQGDFYLDYIIIDGGSRDNSIEIIKRYEQLVNSNSRTGCRGIRYRWISEKDRGQSDALDKGFRLAEGAISAWLNSDDIYEPGAIDSIVRIFAEQPGTDVIYGMGYYIDEEGIRIGKYPTEPFDRQRLAAFNFICQPSMFFRRAALKKVGSINIALHYSMDYELSIRLSKECHFEYVKEFFSSYRLHTESKTVSTRHALESQREALQTVLKHFAWAPVNRVYGYCFHRCKALLPASLSQFNIVLVPVALTFTLVKYMLLNRGIRSADLKTLTIKNLKKLSMNGADLPGMK